MKHLTLPALALMAACATPDPLCDRDAQEWNKFGTPEDTCQAPTREREYLRVRDVEFSDPDYSFRDLVNNPRPEPTYEETAEEFFETIKVIVTSEPGKDPKPDDPDCKGCPPPDCKGC